MNKNPEQYPPLIALVGPTAVGKTSLSLELSHRFDLEIISADSRLFYRGMNIGTAKPTPSERRAIPHHLIDVIDPSTSWSLADFRGAAEEAISGIHKRGRIPLMVGGTGQYLSAFIEGWQPPPRSSTNALRQELETFAEKEGSLALHQRLEELDPDMAALIDHRNVRRVVRALEIIDLTGLPASEQRVKKPPPYRILQIGLTMPRETLYERIDIRIASMLDSGWEHEVKSLLEGGYDFSTPPFSAIGYRQIAAYLLGEYNREEAVQAIRKLTRQLVRRQANWFKRDDPRITWFDVSENVLEEVVVLIEDWLEASSD